MSDEEKNEKESNGVERRSFLKCMAWAGTGLVWAMNAGVLTSCSLLPGAKQKGVFSFVQISDSHIGFNKEPNQDVTKTFQEAVNRINALEEQPAFLIHTGDITQLSTPDQFDTATQVLKSAKASQVYYVPGEHDVFSDDGKIYLERYGKGLAQASGEAGSVNWETTNCNGSRKMLRDYQAARRLSSLLTYLCGRSIQSGVGEQRTARKLCPI